METSPIITSFFVIFSGAAILASIALYTRQPLIIAYIAIGAIAGPYGLHLVSDANMLSEVSEIGIIFLLFLLGLDMHPRSLLHMLRKASTVAVGSSVVFALAGFGIARLSGFGNGEALVVGLAMMFSSTIIGIKLLPTTVLHHRHTGELVVGLLLLQDLIAIITLLVIAGAKTGFDWLQLGRTLLMLPLLVVAAFLIVRYILLRLLSAFDRFHEYIFLLAIGWCLGMAELAKSIGLSLEIGAFVAGVSLATSPISQYMAEHLKPLRDFFLVLFFFSLGAGLDWNLIPKMIWPVLGLTAALLVLKPLVFRGLLMFIQEPAPIAWEVGVRLGQISEFSLLIAYLAAQTGMISETGSVLIQATAILTFVLNTYLVLLKYPSPIAISDRLRRD
ncbi:cation:proton antiporter domain-containing protein [Mangrovitalea sediminis]|uniref:cation:proton antiporter domain-containing protein n=1 Tax=Mangrovitalea sediminis TaxID=1982043 RepID=UPI000BE6007E|nr:cation:proton antiporter [Mangrovitalea sediminis]